MPNETVAIAIPFSFQTNDNMRLIKYGFPDPPGESMKMIPPPSVLRILSLI